MKRVLLVGAGKVLKRELEEDGDEGGDDSESDGSGSDASGDDSSDE